MRDDDPFDPAGLSRYFRGLVWIAGSLSALVKSWSTQRCEWSDHWYLWPNTKKSWKETLKETNDKIKEDESRRTYWGDCSRLSLGSTIQATQPQGSVQFQNPSCHLVKAKENLFADTNLRQLVTLFARSKESKIMNWLSRCITPAHTLW